MAWIGNDWGAATHVDAIGPAGTNVWYGCVLTPPETFSAVRVFMATYGTNTSDVRLELHSGEQSNAPLIKSQVVNDIADNSWVQLDLDTPLPGGTIYQFRVYNVSGSVAIYSFNTSVSSWMYNQHFNASLTSTTGADRAVQILTGGVQAKRWNGTAWVNSIVKRWNGTTWVNSTMTKY